jgi:ubiquitin C-terminal hydrolase
VDPTENVKQGFVGLRNLGATCYINSFVQQLFMVPGFPQKMLQGILAGFV